MPTRDEEGRRVGDAKAIAQALTAYGVPVELLDCGSREEVEATLRWRVAA